MSDFLVHKVPSINPAPTREEGRYAILARQYATVRRAVVLGGHVDGSNHLSPTHPAEQGAVAEIVEWAPLTGPGSERTLTSVDNESGLRSVPVYHIFIFPAKRDYNTSTTSIVQGICCSCFPLKVMSGGVEGCKEKTGRETPLLTKTFS